MGASRVEKIIIGPGHVNYDACHRFCSAARNIANAALYQMRQALFAEKPISWKQADKILKTEYRELYKSLPAAGAQRATKIVGES